VERAKYQIKGKIASFDFGLDPHSLPTMT